MVVPAHRSQPGLRLTDRGIAVILVAGALIVLAALTMVTLTALTVTAEPAPQISRHATQP